MSDVIKLTEGSIIKKLLVVAIPSLLLSLVNTAYNLVDMYFLGQVEKIGQSAVEVISGVGTAGFFTWLAFGFILLTKVGTEVFVSQKLGEGNIGEVDHYGATGIIASFFFGALYAMFAVFVAPMIINIYNLSEGAKENAIVYLRWWGLCFPVYFVINNISSGFNAVGKSTTTLIFGSIGLVVNIILDPIFIVHLGLGAKGAAIATLLAQLIVAIVLIYIFSTKYRPFNFKFKFFDFKHLKQIVTVSAPAAFQSIAFTLVSFIVGFLITRFGDDAVAVQRVGSQIESLGWMIAGGFATAITAFIGQNYGANKLDRVKKGYKLTLLVIVIYSIILTIVMYSFSRMLFGMFIKTEPTLSMGQEYLMILALSQLFMIVEITIEGAFRGLGKTGYPAIIGVVFNVLRIPLIWFFGDVYGVTAIWWVIALTSVGKGFFAYVGYEYISRKVLTKRQQEINIA